MAMCNRAPKQIIILGAALIASVLGCQDPVDVEPKFLQARQSPVEYGPQSQASGVQFNLAAALHSDNVDIRRRAAEAAAKLGRDALQHKEALLYAAEYSLPHSKATVYAVSDLNDPEIMAYDAAVNARNAALNALANIVDEDEKILDRFVEFIHVDSGHTRSLVLKAVFALPLTDARAVVIERILNEQPAGSAGSVKTEAWEITLDIVQRNREEAGEGFETFELLVEKCLESAPGQIREDFRRLKK